MIALLAMLTLPLARGQNDCSTPLHSAAEAGDSDEVSRLLKNGIDANIDDACESKVRPLMLAAAAGNADIVAILLENGASTSVRHPEHGGSPLIGAAQLGHEEIVSQLLAAGAKVGLKDDIGQTALYYACQNGHAAAARALLTAGADATAITHTGLTPWMVATGYGHDDVVSALLEAGAPHGPASSLYLLGALPLPLENAKPFEDSLLGAYDFERLIGGGEAASEAIQLKEREVGGFRLAERLERSAGSSAELPRERREELEEEKAEAFRLAKLALTVPTPVYLKREDGGEDGGGNPGGPTSGGRTGRESAPRQGPQLRLWFDPSLAVWLVSQVWTPARGAEHGAEQGRWQEREQFLRAPPLSPTALDPTQAELWQVRLVAANRSRGGALEETWVAAPQLSLLTGDMGAAQWERQRAEGAPSRRERPAGHAAGATTSGGASGAKKPTKRSRSAPTPSTPSSTPRPRDDEDEELESEVDRLRKRAEAHPAYASLMREARLRVEEQASSDPRVKRGVDHAAKVREQRGTEWRATQEQQAHAQQTKVAEIFSKGRQARRDVRKAEL